MRIYLKTFSGNKIKLNVDPNMTLNSLKKLIEYKEGIPIKEQSLVYKQKTLGIESFKVIKEKKYYERENSKETTEYIITHPRIRKYEEYENKYNGNITLTNLKIHEDSLIYLILPLNGGNLGGFYYVDIEKVKSKNLLFSNEAPNWRRVIQGLNLFGICENDECKCFKKEVIHNVGFPYKKFSITENLTNIKCPICNNIIISNTCGFWNCEYQFIGDKIEKGKLIHIDTNPKLVEDEFEYFQPSNSNGVLWTKLDIYVIEKQKIKYNC